MSASTSLAQGALGWILAHHPGAVPLPGFRDTRQVRDNAGTLAHGPLTPAEHLAVERALGRAA